MCDLSRFARCMCVVVHDYRRPVVGHVDKTLLLRAGQLYDISYVVC